jgi:hypothetical protein
MSTRPQVEEASNEKIGLLLGGNRFGVHSGNQFHICSSNHTRNQSTRTGEVALDLRALPAGLSLRLDYQRPFKIQTLAASALDVNPKFESVQEGPYPKSVR